MDTYSSQHQVDLKNTILQRAQTLLLLDREKATRKYCADDLKILEEAILSCEIWKIAFFIMKHGNKALSDIPVQNIVPEDVRRVFNVLCGIKEEDFVGFPRTGKGSEYFPIAEFLVDTLKYFTLPDGRGAEGHDLKTKDIISHYEKIIKRYKK